VPLLIFSSSSLIAQKEDDLDSLFPSAQDLALDGIDHPGSSSKSTPSTILGHVLMRQDPLYPGAKITLADALCTLFIYFVTGHLAKTQLQRVLDLLHLFMPPNLLPKKVEGILRLFAASDGRLVLHEYCEACFHSFAGNEAQCPGCHELRYRGGLSEQQRRKPRAFFVQLPLERDLVDLFNDEEFVTNLSYRYTRVSKPGVLQDIQDGTVYQRLLREGFLRHPYNLAISFNTDGVSPYKSSSYEMWPLFWQVHDLPPSLRFSLKYTRLCGLWFGKTKPDMNMFLRPFKEELTTFYRTSPPSPFLFDFLSLNSLSLSLPPPPSFLTSSRYRLSHCRQWTG